MRSTQKDMYAGVNESAKQFHSWHWRSALRARRRRWGGIRRHCRYRRGAEENGVEIESLRQISERLSELEARPGLYLYHAYPEIATP